MYVLLHSFYLYLIKISALPWKCIVYVDIILQKCRGQEWELLVESEAIVPYFQHF